MKHKYLKALFAASFLLSACSSGNEAAAKPQNQTPQDAMDDLFMMDIDEEPLPAESSGMYEQNDDAYTSEYEDIPQGLDGLGNLDDIEGIVDIETSSSDAEALPAGFRPVTSINTKVKFDDFYEFDRIVNSGYPADAVFLPTKYVVGEWKFNLRVPDAFGSYSFSEAGYADVDLDYSTGVMSILLHPRIASDGYEQYEEKEAEVGYEPFSGTCSREDNAFHLEGNNMSLVTKYYYYYDNTEYLVTTGYRGKEEFAHIIFVREQE